MDGVELARRVAADLHAQAVAKGRDPWRPYEFAVAEAERQGFDVEPTSPGAAVLDGGRAVLVVRDRLILHENAGTPFEKAFLVAHELGHVQLGDDPERRPTRDFDPARAAEPSPVGVDRVIDYGRRQRREVQMDLFAREFLLPRPVVRRLHLDEKQGYAPGTVVTDHLRAYSAAIRDLKLSADHERGRNRAENSHQPTPRRERQMQGFKSLGSAQRFLSMHAAVYNHFNAQRHLLSARSYRAARSKALLSWNDMTLAA